MPHPSRSELVILLALRLRGTATPDELAGLVGLDVDAVDEELASSSADLAVRQDAAGWTITAAGRARLEALLTKEAVESRTGRHLASLYTAFLLSDEDLAEVFEDPRGADRLADVDARTRPVVAGLAATLARFAPYRARLDDAVARVAAGDHAALLGPEPTSYRAVWAELHRDLLLTLGRAIADDRVVRPRSGHR